MRARRGCIRNCPAPLGIVPVGEEICKIPLLLERDFCLEAVFYCLNALLQNGIGICADGFAEKIKFR